MTAVDTFHAMKRPLVAILRGIRPEETEGIVGNLIEAGFEAIEIPLNSPNAFHSIELAAKLAPGNVLIGAGTVLTIEDVNRLNDAGGRLFVSPNVDEPVLAQAAGLGMVTLPGVFTASEALLAVKTGATGLKFFPASVLGPSGIKAIMAVLPTDITIAAVGGVSEDDFANYMASGINAFGLGSSLYKPGATAGDVRAKAEAVVKAYDGARA